MCVDGRCGHFTTAEEESKTREEFNEFLGETAAVIAGKLPKEIPLTLRAIMASLIVVDWTNEAISEMRAERAADAPAAAA